jgi:hypothetical protein|nr:MAG TPA: major capsid protein [Caudoviricetes sp.]
MNKKQVVTNISNLGLLLLAGIFGGGAMAVVGPLPDAGKTDSGAAVGQGGKEMGNEGIANRTTGEDEGDPDYYSKAIDDRIIKIRPMSTPIDQISRHSEARKIDSMVVKYPTAGTRPISTTTSKLMAAQQATDASVKLEVADASMFTLDDTIRVVGVKGQFDEKGNAYQPGTAPDLVLHVCGRDPSTNMPVVYAVNGAKNAKGQTILVPQIAQNTRLVRMGKACAELDAQTGRFNNIPTFEEQYCQNFMIQIEQSTIDKMSAKNVKWDFSDLEEDGIYDMRLAQENTYLFGSKNRIVHPTKDGSATWFTGGIWHQAGKDIEVGTYVASARRTDITDEQLVDISKDLFVGTGVGNKRKVLFCGSEMLAAFSKIKSDKFRLKESVESWDLQFKSWITDFGEIMVMHHELFDLNGMSDCGFALDPEFLVKSTFLSWQRNILDMKAAGIRNTDAVVLQEIACLYLRYPKAHARLKLKKA